MKVCFITNYINHHQYYLWESFDKLIGHGNFVFFETERLPGWRAKMGYADYSNAPFVTFLDLSKPRAEIRCQLAGFDYIVINIFDKRIISSMPGGTTLFIPAEHFSKSNAPISIKNIGRKVKYFIKMHQLKYSNFVFLCASSFTADDFSGMGFKNFHFLKWGYFPPFSIGKNCKEYCKGGKIHILFVGRMISWKHPEQAFVFSDSLASFGVDFELTFIGTGEKLETIKEVAANKKYFASVKILGSMSNEKVREYMQQTDVYLFLSDRKEGWGAVLNEAMSSGCCCVCSSKAGSTAFLINNSNGFIFTKKNELSLIGQAIANDKSLIEARGEAAIHTIASLWNPDVAASRLYSVIKSLNENKEIPTYKDGPCSSAK